MNHQSMTDVHPLYRQRNAGILLAASSLPSRHGIGDFGKGATRFLDWLHAAGWGFWQILPIGPAGEGHSPYSSPSSFAIEPLLVSLDSLADDGLLTQRALRAPAILGAKNTTVRYTDVRRFKLPRLAEAFSTFVTKRGDRSRAFKAFCDKNDAWLTPWCAWSIAQRGAHCEVAYHAFVQFVLRKQWKALRTQAHKRHINILGDLPIFVSPNSVDVRTNPELFKVDATGAPTFVTGTPPDRFAATGQRWGHPHYHWPAHKREGFRWWVNRMRGQFELYDGVRIDHFIGFLHAWHIPAASKTAKRGEWKSAPGRALLGAIMEGLNSPALFVEELGEQTPQVIQLRDDYGLPGIILLQDAFEEDNSSFLPQNCAKNSILYTGTHDCDTTVGWWRTAPAALKRRVQTYAGPIGAEGHRVHEVLLRLTLAAQSRVAIVPMQDILGLGSAARMNRPGTPRGNWRFRLADGMLRASDAKRCRQLAEMTGRLARPTARKRTTRK